VIVTSVTVKYYNVKMTDEQANDINIFLQNLSHSDIDAVLLAAKIQPGTKEHSRISESVNDLAVSLQAR